MMRLENIKIPKTEAPAHFWDLTLRPKMPFGIQKKERRTCFGNPGYIEEWIDYGSYETKEERDKVLRQLDNFADITVYEAYRAVDNQPEWMQTT